MKKLIVLIDFSPYTPTIIKVAYEWQNSYGVSLQFINQIPGLVPTLANSPGKEQVIAFEKQEADKKFSEELMKLALPREKAEFLAIDSSIIHFLENETSLDDILLLGLKGTGFLKKFLIGSTATNIINHLNRLIIALPKSIEQALPKRLALASHANFPFNEPALTQLLNTIGNSIGEIELLTILSETDDKTESEVYLNALKEKLDDKYQCLVKIYEGTDAFKVIKKRYSEFPDDYLVLQKGSRTLNDKLFRHFFINDLVHEGATPLIILPCKDD
ncbi:hypothetical protein [Cyclobacterium plantarum]|uniref:hypothetical protein n=1 Tax=Cyclobacterium plantarum TaxID=2716263 RepID=UPI003F723B6D